MPNNYQSFTSTGQFQPERPVLKFRIGVISGSEFSTPKHGSWLNVAERVAGAIELHVLTGQCLNRHISTREKIEIEVIAWQNYRNNKEATINWQFKKEDARVKLKRLYASI